MRHRQNRLKVLCRQLPFRHRRHPRLTARSTSKPKNSTPYTWAERLRETRPPSLWKAVRDLGAQARELLTGKYGVGRVIARSFEGDCAANLTRTPRRHDYSLVPPHDTMLDAILAAGRQDHIGVGKIHDIFAGKGIGETIRTSGNTEGLQVTLELADRDFEGLAFVNLVDFDMLYGHCRNIVGYAAAAAEFNDWLPGFMAKMPGDILMVTADHGCDPSYTKTTDHTREHVPFLIYGDEVKPGVNLHTPIQLATIADTVCKALGVDYARRAAVFMMKLPAKVGVLVLTCWPQCWSSIRFR